MDLEKRELHIALFDTYKDLLTDKQREYFTSYYLFDYTLSEIALEKNVSRNAVFDQIKKVLNLLETYEEKLQLLNKREKLVSFANKLEQELKEELLSIIKE